MNKKNYGPDDYSINPLLPCHEFVPDGEPHVFGNRMYVYGSHDLYDSGEMCQGDYVCYSAAADHPVQWTYEGVIFKRTQDPFAKKQLDFGRAKMMNSNLFAPDVVEIENKYYLYYGVGLSESGFGVAVADSPAGAFAYLGRVRYPETEKPEGWKDCHDGIEDGDMAFGMGMPAINLKPGRGFGIHLTHYPYDPGIIFEAGRLYLYYGLGYCRVVELDVKDKRTVLRNERTDRFESDFLVPPMFPSFDKTLSKKNTGGMGMVNAPSIRKVDNRFCLTYYAMGPHKANAMCYAFAENPLGPFTYGGILVSLGNALYQNQLNPTDYVGNTHGGMVKVGDTWYTMYHRQTGNRSGGRQVCVAALNRTKDGGFEHAEHTSLGFSGETLPAFYCWPAYMACYITDAQGKTKINSKSPYIALKEFNGGYMDDHSGKEVLQVLTNLTAGSVAGFKYLDFGEESSENATIILTAKASSDGVVHICIDAPAPQHCVAEVQITGKNEWLEYSCPIKAISGTHAVYMVINCGEKPLGDIAFFEFVK